MSSIVKAIVETYTNPTELYIRSSNTEGKSDGWQHIDSLYFHAERKLRREIEDLEFWIPKQQDREANAKRWAQRDKSRCVGDEISTLNFKASVASAKAENFALLVMQKELQAAQKAYKKLTGTQYTSVAANAVDGEMSEEMAAIVADFDALSA
tara:strand:+ start:213 stop:671 length:459 start_codon:yes stop_codon:yes gene_type:complete